MSSKRETAMTALAAALLETNAVVWRDTDISREIPPDGLIEVTEGDSNIESIMLSPLSYNMEQPAEIRAAITEADEDLRDAAMDRLLLAIAAQIEADRTLGGAVDFAEIGPPSFQSLEADGAAKVALLTIILSYNAPGSPLA